jgi:hypothetical protein
MNIAGRVYQPGSTPPRPLRQRHIRVVGRVLIAAVALQRHVDEVPLVARLLRAESCLPTAEGEEGFPHAQAVATIPMRAAVASQAGQLLHFFLDVHHRLNCIRWPAVTARTGIVGGLRSRLWLHDPARLRLAAVEQCADHRRAEEDRTFLAHAIISL